MEIRSFHGCCGALTLVGLGQCGDYPEDHSEEDLKGQIEYYIRHGRGNQKAILTATTVKSQKSANAVLKELGFKSSKWCKRHDRAGSNLIKMWWLPLGD